MSHGSAGRCGEVGEEEAYANVPFLFPQEAPFSVFEDNYIWGPTFVPGSSPPGGAFFFQLSTQIKPTWWCLSVLQTSCEGNLFSHIPLERSLRLFGGWRGGKAKGGGRSRPVCILLFLTSPSRRKLQPPTNQPSNHPANQPTNMVDRPPLDRSSFRSLPSSTLLVLFSLFESLFFLSWRPWMPPLLPLQKASKKRPENSKCVCCGLQQIKHEHFHKKIHGEFWALTFRPALFWRFLVIQQLFF